MTARTPAWLRWLLLAAFAGCLNPHPDDEPTAVPVVAAPGGQEPSSDSSGAPSTPPLLIGDEDGTEPQPGAGHPRDVADAGVPPEDAGATSCDAGASGNR